MEDKRFSKVPEITIYFWIIKVLCTTVGETFADYLNGNLNFGLSGTILFMGALFVFSLFFQFKAKKYVPSVYWLTVVLISVVGTLITDFMTDTLGISLVTSNILFGLALAATFIIWYIIEKTLSIHSIFTKRRETFYWLAVLFTFALGTATGDLIAERFKVGYLNSLYLFAGLIVVATIAFYVVKAFLAKDHKFQFSNAVLVFWIVYILTRPLGASIGDYLSQAHDDGGIGLGTTITSVIFLVPILITVLYLSATKKDTIDIRETTSD